MSEVQTNLIQAQESLFFLLKEITDKSDEEIKNLSIKFLDQVQKNYLIKLMKHLFLIH